MDDSLKNLESQLEGLVPRALSDEGRERCHDLIDELVAGESLSRKTSPIGLSWLGTAAAASVALSLGLGGGWYLGQDDGEVPISSLEDAGASIASDFDQLDHETWMVSADAPGIYVAKDGQVREILQETEVTKEVVKHRESGTVVTLEKTDHYLIDSVKSEF